MGTQNPASAALRVQIKARQLHRVIIFVLFSVLMVGIFGEQELEKSYDQSLESAELQGNSENKNGQQEVEISEIGDEYKVYHHETDVCSGEIEQLIPGALSLNIVTRPGLIATKDARLLEDAIVSVYDTLASQTCKSGYRSLAMAYFDMNAISTPSTELQSFQVHIDVEVRCKGCSHDKRIVAGQQGARAQSRARLEAVDISSIDSMRGRLTDNLPRLLSQRPLGRHLSEGSDVPEVPAPCDCPTPSKELFTRLLNRLVHSLTEEKGLVEMSVTNVENAAPSVLERRAPALNSYFAPTSMAQRGYSKRAPQHAPGSPPAFSKSADASTPEPSLPPSTLEPSFSVPSQLPTNGFELPMTDAPISEPPISESPTLAETDAPSLSTSNPTSQLTDAPITEIPSLSPTFAPTTDAPSNQPTIVPSSSPSFIPTLLPSQAAPTTVPSGSVGPTAFSCLDQECCDDEDCTREGEICFLFAGRCINDGPLRFSLYWEGDDDLDLYVETPKGTVISFNNQFDPVTGGRMGEDTNQLEFGNHIENTYFPERAPEGIYRFYQIPFNIRGEEDTWTMTVYVDGVGSVTVTGTGLSDTFTFNYFKSE